MAIIESGARVTLKNILYLTDFSESSEAALPFASAIAREYEARLYAFHVLLPYPMAYATPESTAAMLTSQEETADAEMLRIEAQLAGLACETIVEREFEMWRPVERAIRQHAIDLIVLGTHGRTGAQRLLLGSVAEELFRRSHVPVLTIGPWVRKETHFGARFRRVLYATDFSPESLAAAPYAISMAQENQADLILLHVMRNNHVPSSAEEVAANEVRLSHLLAAGTELWCHPETIVTSGNPADQILKAAKERQADLIVLGVHSAAGHLGAATHLQRATAHKVVAHALCPVLTVRG